VSSKARGIEDCVIDTAIILYKFTVWSDKSYNILHVRTTRTRRMRRRVPKTHNPVWANCRKIRFIFYYYYYFSFFFHCEFIVPSPTIVVGFVGKYYIITHTSTTSGSAKTNVIVFIFTGGDKLTSRNPSRAVAEIAIAKDTQRNLFYL
jgi:hypothetical protein